jgi:hypothetical protein
MSNYLPAHVCVVSYNVQVFERHPGYFSVHGFNLNILWNNHAWTLLLNYPKKGIYSYFTIQGKMFACKRDSGPFCHNLFLHSRENSHLKYLTMRTEKLRVFSIHTYLHESLRMFQGWEYSQTQIFELRVFLGITKHFMTVGPGSQLHLNVY